MGRSYSKCSRIYEFSSLMGREREREKERGWPFLEILQFLKYVLPFFNSSLYIRFGNM